ncbi:MAG: 16S rRNA (cytosine(1402)-N(4))-methyltransferase [Flavobacteriia bacterium]|nr:MAG: 16S rRNA (cytosine(1402)-N(4))-methyltransferase [Flavobacteriia bacterium]
MTKNNTYHDSVLLNESIEGLNIKPNGVYVDVTYGGGGHSKAILNALDANGKLLAFDTDPDALANKIDDERLVLISGNFRFIKRFLKFHGFEKVDGILADLGVSSHQFDEPERGFSTRFDGNLDMRMNVNSPMTAAQVINTYTEEELTRIFRDYGELRQAKRFAKKIVSQRNDKPINGTTQLKQCLSAIVPKSRENKIYAQVFQAVRLEVNQELEVLKEFLTQTPDLINKGGRLSVISYHSLEDRLVKRFIRNGMFEGEPERDIYGNYEVPFKKVGSLIVPNEAEIKQNNRARSAKLRIAERL